MIFTCHPPAHDIILLLYLIITITILLSLTNSVIVTLLTRIVTTLTTQSLSIIIGLIYKPLLGNPPSKPATSWQRLILITHLIERSSVCCLQREHDSDD